MTPREELQMLRGQQGESPRTELERLRVREAPSVLPTQAMPQPAVSTAVEVTPQPEQLRPDTMKQKELYTFDQPQEMTAQPPSWLDVIGREGASALQTALTRPGSMERLMGEPQRAYGEAMRESQTWLQNLLAGGIGISPYIANPALFPMEIAAQPETVPQLIERVGTAYQDVMAKTKTLQPALDIAAKFQKARGLPETWSGLPEELKTGLMEEAKAGATERFHKEPFETALGLAMPALVGRGAVKGGGKLAGKFIKPKEPPMIKGVKGGRVVRATEQPPVEKPTIPTKLAKYKKEGAVKAGEKPPPVEVQTIEDLSFKLPSVTRKRVISEIESNFSYLLSKTPAEGLRELSKAKIIWQNKLNELQNIAKGRNEPTGELLNEWRYYESRTLKQLTADEWAQKVAVPSTESYLHIIGKAEGAIKKIQPKQPVTPKPPPVKAKEALGKVEKVPKVETAKQAVQEIIEGKRESRIGTKEFKERMLAELDKIKATKVGRYERTAESKIISIPGDGEFGIDVGADIYAIKTRVRRLSEKPISRTDWTKGYRKITQRKTIKEHIKAGEVEFVPAGKKPAPVELGAFGTPETFRAFGQSAVDLAKTISKTTSEIIEKAKVPPKIKAGVEQAKESMIEHDRQTRASEFTNKQLTKVIEDAVPNRDRQMLMVHAYEHKMRGKEWNQLSDLEKSLTQWLGKEKAKLNRFIEENEVLETMKTKGVNHIFHHWINPKSGKPYKAMYGKFSKGLPQAKQRTIPTYESGVAKGLKPATTNLGELIGMEWEAATRAYQARSMFKTLNTIEAGTEKIFQRMTGSKKLHGLRMAERWDLLSKQGLTEEYVRYSHPALDKALTFKTADGTLMRLKGAVGVRKELYPFVRAYMESPNYSTLEQLNFITKSMKLGFSLFHVVSLAAQEAANWRMPVVNIPRGLRYIRELGPEMKLLHQEGLEIFKGYEDVGYQRSFFEGASKAGKIGNIALKPVEIMRSLIFDVVQPGMKASFAVDQYNKLLPKYLKKGMAKERCARDVVKMADGHFSGEHYKRSLLETNRFMVKLYFSPEGRRFWQAALLSPTWQREHLLVAKNVAKSFMPDKMIKKLGLAEIGPVKAEFRKYALGAICLIGAVDYINYRMTERMDGQGRHLWQNPGGKGFAIRAPWNEPGYTKEIKGGKTRRIKGSPAYIRPLKSVFEVAEWARTPIKKFTYKASPVLTGIAHQMSPSRYQKQYEGWPDIPQRAWDFLCDVGSPIMASQMADWVRGRKTLPAATLPFFGMPTSKLKREETEKLYYGRMVKAMKAGDKTGFRLIKREFKDMGYNYNVKKYFEAKKGG